MSDPAVAEPQVLEAASVLLGADDPKTAVLAMPEKIEIEGFTCHAFSAMRKGFLEMTDNQIIKANEHSQAYLKEHDLPDSVLTDPAKSWDVMAAAVPDFMHHLTALAYICVTSAPDLAKLIGKPKVQFHEAVLAWWETLTELQWQQLTIRAFTELIESNLGNDYQIKSEPGARATPNS